MPRSRHSAEAIINTLRQADVRLGQGKAVAELAKAPALNATTDYRWRAEYRGMQLSRANRLQELERENARLPKAVADLTLDKMSLREAAAGNFRAPSAAGAAPATSRRRSASPSGGRAGRSARPARPNGPRARDGATRRR